MNTQTVELALPRGFNWQAALGFFRLRAITGLERVGEADYTRTIGIGRGFGLLTLAPSAGADGLVAWISTAEPVDLAGLVDRLRLTLDLDADTFAISRHLSSDKTLAPLVADRPDIRVRSHWDPYEDAIRAILGQQVSMVAARRLLARFLDRAGLIVGDVDGAIPWRLFPAPERVLTADFSDMGMPGSRVRTLIALTQAYLDTPKLFDRGATPEETIDRLLAIKGIGPWTAHYIAIRSCREPDAFPASDAGLLRGSAGAGGERPTPAALLQRAQMWRPYRAYAAHHIWADDEAKTMT